MQECIKIEDHKFFPHILFIRKINSKKIFSAFLIVTKVNTTNLFLIMTMLVFLTSLMNNFEPLLTVPASTYLPIYLPRPDR